MSGDLDAILRQYDLVYDKVYSWVSKKVGNQEDAQDIMQEVWIKIQPRSSKLVECDISGYIFAVASNCFKDYNKKKKRINEICDRFDVLEDKDVIEEIYDPEQISFELEIENKELYELLYRCLQHLPTDVCTSIKLRFFEELKYQNIAEKLKMPVNTVTSKVQRGLKKIRKELEESEYLGRNT